MKRTSCLLLSFLLLTLLMFSCESKQNGFNSETAKAYSIDPSQCEHDFEVVNRKELTCTENGYEDLKCKKCGTTKRETLEAPGHDFAVVDEIAGNCYEYGKTIYRCSICGEEKEEVNYVTTHKTAPILNKCENDTVCALCGTIIEVRTGHDYDENNCCKNCGCIMPQHFEGSGDAVLRIEKIPVNYYAIRCENYGDSNFIVYAHDTDENRTLLVNEIGTYSGTTLFIGSMEPGMIEITSNGAWTVDVKTVFDLSTSTLSGTGDSVSQWFYLSEGTNIIKASHNGDSNFAVRVYNTEYVYPDLLFNEIGEYSGEKIYKSSAALHFVEVIADGEWTLDFGEGDELTIVN